MLEELRIAKCANRCVDPSGVSPLPRFLSELHLLPTTVSCTPRRMALGSKLAMMEFSAQSLHSACRTLFDDD